MFPPKNERTNSTIIETSGRLVFICFMEEIEDAQKTFRNWLTFTYVKIGVEWLIQKLKYVPNLISVGRL